ncbi:MAG: ScyD/ScyE family protein [Pyrinomonadaceae bacterium]
MPLRKLLSLIVITLTCAVTGANAQPPCPGVSEFATGLNGPVKLILSQQRNLLVTETGDGINAGRISIVDRNGARRTLLDGLPSAVNAVGERSGPTGLLMRGRTLYVAIGEGDTTLQGPIPGVTQIANPSPSSPIFNSVLAIHFSAHVEKTTDGFTLNPETDYAALDSGARLRLDNGRGDKLTVELVVDFPDFVPNPLPFLPNFPNVRNSNPFALELIGNQLYVVDAGLNAVVAVDLSSGDFETLTTFPPIPNPLPFGPLVVEAVPTSIREHDGQFLVTLFRGFPFPPGAAEVQSVDPDTGSRETFITGLTSAIDVLPVKDKGGDTDFLTLEFSANLLAEPPELGRLQFFETPAGPPNVIADCLITPTSMVRDPKTGTLFVTELAFGRIVTVDTSQ